MLEIPFLVSGTGRTAYLAMVLTTIAPTSREYGVSAYPRSGPLDSPPLLGAAAK
jgi:hypothetical protein